METKEMSFEEINQHLAKFDTKKFEQGGDLHFTAAAAAANPAQVLQKICAIYKTVKPILVAISNFSLLPANWRAAIKTFINLLNTLCP